jgi:hypothetical protein
MPSTQAREGMSRTVKMTRISPPDGRKTLLEVVGEKNEGLTSTLL